MILEHIWHFYELLAVSVFECITKSSWLIVIADSSFSLFFALTVVCYPGINRYVFLSFLFLIPTIAVSCIWFYIIFHNCGNRMKRTLKRTAKSKVFLRTRKTWIFLFLGEFDEKITKINHFLIFTILFSG